MIFMETRVSATEAARTFSDLINRVLYRGDVFVVERGGRPVCRIVPAGTMGFKVRDLIDLWKAIPKPDQGFGKIVEKVNKSQPPLPESPWER